MSAANHSEQSHAETALRAQERLLAALRAWWNAEQAFLFAGGAQSADAADNALDSLKEVCGRAWGGGRG
jgi:hypothetical protein